MRGMGVWRCPSAQNYCMYGGLDVWGLDWMYGDWMHGFDWMYGDWIYEFMDWIGCMQVQGDIVSMEEVDDGAGDRVTSHQRAGPSNGPVSQAVQNGASTLS